MKCENCGGTLKMLDDHFAECWDCHAIYSTAALRKEADHASA